MCDAYGEACFRPLNIVWQQGAVIKRVVDRTETCQLSGKEKVPGAAVDKILLTISVMKGFITIDFLA